MKKIKSILIVVGLIIAVAGSVAMRPLNCVGLDNFYYNGSGYINLGGPWNYGVTYHCWDEPPVCTYYRPNPIGQPNTYAPCRQGLYAPIFGISDEKKK